MNRTIIKLDKSLKDIIFLFILTLIPRFSYYFYKLLGTGGLPQAFDTKVFIAQALNFIYFGIIDKDVNGIFYVSFYSFLGLFLKVYNNTDAYVAFQMLINALTVILVYKLGLEILNKKAAFIAGILYSFLIPLIQWSIFITTDSFFISLMILQAYLAVKCVKYNKTSYWIYLILLSIYMIFFRPTGIITLAFTFIYLIINSNIKGLFKKHKISCIAALILIIMLIIIIGSKILKHPIMESIQLNLYWLLTEVYSNGQMYDIKTPYDYSFKAKIPPGYDFIFAFNYFKLNFLNITLLYLRRIVAFAGVWIWRLKELSLPKSIGYMVFYGSAFFLMVIGSVDMFKRGLLKKGSIILFMIASIMIFTVFFFMDSAYRYRVPALVFGIFLLAQGIDFIFEFFKAHIKKV